MALPNAKPEIVGYKLPEMLGAQFQPGQPGIARIEINRSHRRQRQLILMNKPFAAPSLDVQRLAFHF